MAQASPSTWSTKTNHQTKNSQDKSTLIIDLNRKNSTIYNPTTKRQNRAKNFCNHTVYFPARGPSTFHKLKIKQQKYQIQISTDNQLNLIRSTKSTLHKQKKTSKHTHFSIHSTRKNRFRLKPKIKLLSPATKHNINQKMIQEISSENTH